MTSFELLLNEFDLALRKYNPVNYARLYPPLAELELEASLKNLKINNEDFGTLYKWKNGFDFTTDSYICFDIFFNGTLLSLDLVQEDVLFNEKEGTWRNTLIPLIGNDEREWLLFDNRKGKDYEKLFFYSPSIPSAAIKPVTCYDSIFAMVDTTITAYRNGIIQYDPDENCLNFNVDRYFALARERNPKSQFWMM
jgi:hypothetical protein